MTEVNHYNILLNTANALNNAPAVSGVASVSNCTFIVNSPSITLTNENNYFELQIVNCTTAFSFDIINVNNNTLTGCILTINGTPTTFTLVIPPGNYDIYQLCQTYQKLIQEVYTTATSGSGPSTNAIVVSANIVSGVVNITMNATSPDTSISLFLPFSQGLTLLGSMLGWLTDITVSSSTTGGISAPYHFNVAPYQQLFIRSNKLMGTNYEYITGSNQLNSNIIASITIFTANNTYLNSNAISPLKIKLLTKNIDVIDLYLTNDFDNLPLDLKGIPMYLSMILTEIRPNVYVNQQYDYISSQLKNTRLGTGKGTLLEKTDTRREPESNINDQPPADEIVLQLLDSINNLVKEDD